MDKTQEQPTTAGRPISALLQLARLTGWKGRRHQPDNSGEGRGHTGAALGPGAGPAEFGAPDRAFMLALARRTLSNATGAGPGPDLRDAPDWLGQKRACFVTLTKGGALRGCVGNLQPQAPLAQAIVENARGAALRDPRFPPVVREEVGEVLIEISVLSEPQALAFKSPEELLARLRPFEDGVLLRIGQRTATFLPQVWAQLPDKTAFLDHLAEKAGCARGAWRGSGVAVSVYHVESFEENSEPGMNN